MDLSRRNLLLGLGGATVAASASGLVARSLLKHAVSGPGAAPALRPAAAPETFPEVAMDGPELAAPAASGIKRVALHNLHTGDKLDAVFYENGKYVPDAMSEAMRVLRDWRNGEEHTIDPRLFDVLHDVSQTLETRAPFQIISGYRSPVTNAAMHAHSAGVASHSQHMLGKASDIRVQGVELTHLHRAALSLRSGGVGLYPVSNFVHVDVGPVRSWTGV